MPCQKPKHTFVEICYVATSAHVVVVQVLLGVHANQQPLRVHDDPSSSEGVATL